MSGTEIGSSLNSYLDSLAAESQVNCGQVSTNARNQLTQKISRLTIDQLAHEKEQAQKSLNTLSLAFAKDELSQNQSAKYSDLCTAHQNIFATNTGKLATVGDLNEKTHSAMEELQQTLAGKNVNLEKIQADFNMQQNQKEYLDQMLEVVNVAQTINQCLHGNKLPQACQLIISFEYAFPGDQERPYPLLLQLIAKEVQVLKKKVISMLYVFTEQSYDINNYTATQKNTRQKDGANSFYTTKVSLQLLKVLGESQERVHSTFLRVRARHVRERVQKQVLNICSSDQQKSDINGLLGILKPYLDTVTRIYAELNTLEIQNKDNWLYERYQELRKLTKILLKQVLQASMSQSKSGQQLDWFDTMLTLNNLVNNFNLALGCQPDGSISSDQNSQQPLIPLCITDLLVKLLFAKVDQTVEKYKVKIARTLNDSDQAFTELIETDIAETKAQIEQVGMAQEIASEYVKKCLYQLALQLPKTVHKHLELAQATQGTTHFDTDQFLDSLVGLMKSHDAVVSDQEEQKVRAAFSIFETIFF